MAEKETRIQLQITVIWHARMITLRSLNFNLVVPLEWVAFWGRLASKYCRQPMANEYIAESQFTGFVIWLETRLVSYHIFFQAKEVKFGERSSFISCENHTKNKPQEAWTKLTTIRFSIQLKQQSDSNQTNYSMLKQLWILHGRLRLIKWIVHARTHKTFTPNVYLNFK